MLQFGNYTAKPVATGYYSNSSKQPAPWQNVGLGVQNLQYTQKTDTLSSKKAVRKSKKAVIAASIAAAVVLIGAIFYFGRKRNTPAPRTENLPNPTHHNGFRPLNTESPAQRANPEQFVIRANPEQFVIRRNPAAEGAQGARLQEDTFILSQGEETPQTPSIRDILRNFTDENPEIVAQVLTDWLHGF